MSTKLTWADVAHYYAKNHAQIGVFLAAHHAGTASFCGCDREYFLSRADADDLPELIALSDITEEDARMVLTIANVQIDSDVELRAVEMLLGKFGLKMEMGGKLLGLLTGMPVVTHYLISKNYNVFGVETYKEAKP